MEKERQVYFGTLGRPGHYSRPLNCFFNSDDEILWFSLDTAEHLHDIVRAGEYYRNMEAFAGSWWSVYAVPFSVDDSRGGCHTEFWWEGNHSKEEMLSAIRQSDFLKRQFRM